MLLDTTHVFEAARTHFMCVHLSSGRLCVRRLLTFVFLSC
jgi:hypothetical protein